MNIKPLFDRVVIEYQEQEDKTSSGIILSSSAKEEPQLAKVLAVGPGTVEDGKKIDMVVKEGDLILCSKYSGSEFKLDGKNVVIVKQTDILAVVN